MAAPSGQTRFPLIARQLHSYVGETSPVLRVLLTPQATTGVPNYLWLGGAVALSSISMGFWRRWASSVGSATLGGQECLGVRGSWEGVVPATRARDRSHKSQTTASLSCVCAWPLLTGFWPRPRFLLLPLSPWIMAALGPCLPSTKMAPPHLSPSWSQTLCF